MGKKGAQRHMKRQVSPVFWTIPRKGYVWTVKPSPGPHRIRESIPLGIVLRDLMGYAETLREAEIILKSGKVEVDGRTRRDEGLPVGLMDVVEMPESKQYFRLLPSRKGVILHPITKEESTFKLCRVESKTTVNEGHIQYNLHDGANLLVKTNNPLRPAGTSYKRYDALKVTVPQIIVLDHLKFAEGILALVTGGESRGRYGKVQSIEKRGNFPDTVTLTTSNKEEVRTIADYVIPIGSDSPLISLPKGV